MTSTITTGITRRFVTATSSRRIVLCLLLAAACLPARDFQERDGTIIGPWWQGHALGVAYFTGPHAQRLPAFERIGQQVAKELGLPYQEIHKEHLLPSEAHPESVLLYPDGTARVALLIMPGGNSAKTMMDILGVTNAASERARFAEGRQRPRKAFRSGMNYMGVCGGFFTGDSGYTIPRSLSTGWGLWPGRSTGLGPGRNPPFPDVVVDPALRNHPLYQATDNGMLRGMFFNGGPAGIEDDIPDTVYFGRYQGGNMPALENQWFCIVYTPSDQPASGRAVMSTGHPEAHHQPFALAMARHAVAREYQVPRRDIAFDEPLAGISGDRQMQYFSVTVEAGQTLTATLGDLEDDVAVLLRHALPPLIKRSDARGTRRRRDGTATATVRRTRAGTYWIGVYGNHAMTGGVPYTLTVSLP